MSSCPFLPKFHCSFLKSRMRFQKCRCDHLIPCPSFFKGFSQPFQMNFQFLHGHCEALCGLCIHLPGLLSPSAIVFIFSAFLPLSLLTLFCLEDFPLSSLLQLRLQVSTFIISSLGRHFLPLNGCPPPAPHHPCRIPPFSSHLTVMT